MYTFYLSVSIYISICITLIYISIYPTTYLSVSQYTSFGLSLCINISTCLPVNLSITSLSTYISFHLYIFVHVSFLSFTRFPVFLFTQRPGFRFICTLLLFWSAFLQANPKSKLVCRGSEFIFSNGKSEHTMRKFICFPSSRGHMRVRCCEPFASFSLWHINLFFYVLCLSCVGWFLLLFIYYLFFPVSGYYFSFFLFSTFFSLTYFLLFFLYSSFLLSFVIFFSLTSFISFSF